MDTFTQGFSSAFTLIARFDPELYGIAGLSLCVSCSATILATAVTVPLAVFLGLHRFRGEETFSRLTGALMSIPSVAVGLFAAMLFSRRGPFGGFNLLYTPAAMAIAQALLVSPLSFGLAYQLSRQRGRENSEAARTLGASRLQTLRLVLRELRPALAANLFIVFARAISEVGTVMIVGGNIRYQTRVLTTAIATSASMGDTGFAVALGLILVTLALALSSAVSFFPKRDREAAG